MAEHLTKPIPPENIPANALLGVEIPELDPPIDGKVRRNWIGPDGSRRAILTTDWQSAFNYRVGAVPEKSVALNMTAASEFDRTAHLFPNHKFSTPHPSVLIARQTDHNLPVEVIVRGDLAKSGSPTSVWRHYNAGARTIYGIDFPDGLKPNQELPMGPIITPTTKGEVDEMLTNDEARLIVDGQFGNGVWAEASRAALILFEDGRRHFGEHGLRLVDTKYEFGLIDGQLILIDEIHTPDSSRMWNAATFRELVAAGLDPEIYDKEIIRDYLKLRGFNGEPDQDIPVIEPQLITSTIKAYQTPYRMLHGQDLPAAINDHNIIRSAILGGLAA